MSVLLTKNCDRIVQNVEDEIHQRISEQRFDTFFYVVPTKRKVRQLQRDLLQFVPNKVAPAFPLFTLNSLARKLHSCICVPKIELNVHEQAIFLTDILSEKREELFYFFKVNGKQNLPRGTFKKILEAINYYKEKGITPADLQTELNRQPQGESEKLRDIITVYDAYENKLATQYTDTNSYLLDVNTKWSSGNGAQKLRSAFPALTTFYIAGFDEFSRPEMTMLQNLADAKMESIILFDYQRENDELFGHLKENFENFRTLGFRLQDSYQSVEKDSFQHQIAKKIFSFATHSEKIDTPDFITIIESHNRVEEVELIAKQIKRIVRDQPDKALNSICVAMHQTHEYTNLLREVFHRYNIPANFTDRFPLDQSPIVVHILAWLEIARGNYRLEDILRSLSSSFSVIDKSKEAIIDSANLATVAALLKIPRGKEDWPKKIDERLKFLSLELPLDEFEKEKLQKEKTSLEKALRDFLFLTKMVVPFESALTPTEFRANLFSMLERLNLVSTIISSTKNSEEELLEKDVKAFQQFLTLVDEVVIILERDERAKLPHRIDFYVEYLRRAISEVRYNVREQYGYGVFVSTIEETRGLHFDTMFILGLVDGEFPLPYETEVFISPLQRKRRETYFLTEQRYLFYQGLTNFTDHLYFSYPLLDGEKELVRSSFVDAVSAVCTVEQWTTLNEHPFPSDLLNGIYSYDDLYRHSNDSKESDTIIFVNDRVKKNLRKITHSREIEIARYKNFGWGDYRGLLFNALSNDVQQWFSRKKESVYSVSQLETYGKCPFQYFAKNLLRLNEFEEMEEEFSQRELGSVLHSVLFEFFEERKVKHLPKLSECSQMEFEQAVLRIKEIAREKFSALEIPDVFWLFEKEKILGDGNERKGILQSVLERERENSFDIHPSFFELSFGFKKNSDKVTGGYSVEEPINLDGVRLRGKIDRIDVGKTYFNIIDYKSGKIPDNEARRLGISLQLPLYLGVAKKILHLTIQKEFLDAAGLYYCLTEPAEVAIGLARESFQNITFKKVGTGSGKSTLTDEEYDEEITRAVTLSSTYIQGIASGNFPLTVEEKAIRVCKYCSFQTMCRIRNRTDAEL
ncbi:MAG: exodeoxyribonuclease V subunit gamma [Ignavibacteriales bacterium]|nr:exodeoxyribonuclease V subunit gamma [Ignavibacteriales bacterium]